jgi:hypothetical protein
MTNEMTVQEALDWADTLTHDQSCKALEVLASEVRRLTELLRIAEAKAIPHEPGDDSWPREQYQKIQDFVIGRGLFRGSPDDKSHADIVLELAERALNRPAEPRS